MANFFSSLPWAAIGAAYTGLALYLLTSVANPADESFHSIIDVFVNKTRTVVSSILVVPVLVGFLKWSGELTLTSAFLAGYANLSLIRKASDTYLARTKIGG